MAVTWLTFEDWTPLLARDYMLIRLKLLGGIDVCDDAERPLTELLRQPRLLALLAYCAIEARSGFITVEGLCQLFWPEASAGHARHSLNQLFHLARRITGSELFERHGKDLVRVQPGAIACDAIALLEGVAPDASLLSGSAELMPSFGGPSTAKWDEWLDGTRQVIRQKYVERCLQSCESALTDDRPDHARDWARRAVLADPLGSRAAIMHLRAVCAAEGHAAAFQIYEQYAARLRAEFLTAPPLEVRSALVSLLPRAADQLAATSSHINAVPAATEDKPPSFVQPRSERRRSERFGRRTYALGGAFVLLAILVLLPELRPGVLRGGAVAPALDIVVASLSGGAVEGREATSTLIDGLRRHSLRVAPVSVNGLTETDVRGRIRAAYLLSGHVQSMAADSIRVRIRLSETAAGLVIAAFEVEAERQALNSGLLPIGDSIRAAVGRHRRLSNTLAARTNERARAAAVAALMNMELAADLRRSGGLESAASVLALADSAGRLAIESDTSWGRARLLRSRVQERAGWTALMLGNVQGARQHIRLAIIEAGAAIDRGELLEGAEQRGRLLYQGWLVDAPRHSTTRSLARSRTCAL